MDTRLREILEKMVEEDKKKKKPKLRGKVGKIIETKKGHLMFILEDERRLLVNRYSPLFVTAVKIIIGDEVYAEGKTGINIMFCDVLQILNRNPSQARLSPKYS